MNHILEFGRPFRATLILVFLALATIGLAHPGLGDHHHHEPKPISETEAQARSKKVVAKKVDQGKLAEQWLQLEPAKTYQKDYGYGPEWVVEFHDDKATDETKRVLYVFLSRSGKTLGANFNGQ